MYGLEILIRMNVRDRKRQEGRHDTQQIQDNHSIEAEATRIATASPQRVFVPHCGWIERV